MNIVFTNETREKLRKNLQRAAKLVNNVQTYRLSLALFLFSEGKSIKEVANSLHVTLKTVYNWLRLFICGGMSWINGLHYQGRGRKSKLTKAQKVELYDLIAAGPDANGFNCGIWNTAMISDMIVRKFGVLYNLNYLSSFLKKLHLSYQKACFVSGQEEEKYKQARENWIKKTLPAIVKQAKQENAIVLFGDEVSFAMWGSLGRTWAPRGQQPTVKTKGIRKGLKMFGVIEVRGGGFQYMESLSYSLRAKSLRLLKGDGLPVELLKKLAELKNEQYPTKDIFLAALNKVGGKDLIVKYQSVILMHAEAAGKFNGDSYIEFLTQVLNHYKGKVILVEDGAPYHKRKDVIEFKESFSRLTVYPLPAFSPDYNPIEKLWKNTKRDATHLKYFKVFEELRDSVIYTFESYMKNPNKVSCVMKKLREDYALTA